MTELLETIIVAHAGIMAHSHLMVSLVQAHYINKGIRENKKLSVNVVDGSWLAKADKMGTSNTGIGRGKYIIVPIRTNIGTRVFQMKEDVAECFRKKYPIAKQTEERTSY